MGKPARAATLLWSQVRVLGVAGIPLTMRWGALGTCGAVGLALLVGMVLAYHYVRQNLVVNLGTVFGFPVLVGAGVLIGYAAVLRFIPVGNLGLLLQLLIKAVWAFLAFYALTFALRPRETGERVRYVWGLWRERAL
ncbi:MAG: hypothetical protein ACP5N6_14475, partial [Anaerolineae bacterium]